MRSIFVTIYGDLYAVMVRSRTMRGIRIRHYLSVMMAVVLLSLAIGSRAPQSKCRCHEKKSTRSQTQDSKPCVFGQMRSLTASYVLPATVGPEERLTLATFVASALIHTGVGPQLGMSDRPRARSPPAFNVFSI
jgi:hypothetical protein